MICDVTSLLVSWFFPFKWMISKKSYVIAAWGKLMSKIENRNSKI